MIWNRWISALGLVVIAVALVGCKHLPPPPPYVCVDDEIRIGDVLVISLLDTPSTDQLTDKDFAVRSDGTVNLPRLNMITMKAVGKKFGEFERDIQSAYITNRIYNRVTVAVRPGVRYYTVSGEVTSHGIKLPYTGPTTLLRAIAAAGDFTEYANKRKVEITRASGQREKVDCKTAIENSKYDRSICPGDHIFVPRSL